MDAAALAAAAAAATALEVWYTSLPLLRNDFQLRFFGVVSIARRHALTSVKSEALFQRLYD